MARHTNLAVLGRPDLRRYIVARFFAGMSHTLLRAAFAWQVYEITDSTLHLGLIGLVQFVPAAPLILVAGAAADAYDRKRIVMLAQGAAMAISLLLAWANVGGDAHLALVYAAIVALAAAHAFESPSGAALLPTLVPPALFPAATTVHSTLRNLAWATGPVAMGFVAGAYGIDAAYALAGALYAGSVIVLARVRSRFQVIERRSVDRDSIREGLSFVRHRPVLLGSMTLDMFAVVFASVTALLPVYARDVLEVGERGYGLLSGALELGTLLMAGLLLALPPVRRAGPALLVAVGAFGIATVLFGMSSSFWVSMAALVLAGMADQVSMVARSIIVQLSTPDALRGRVNSVNLLFISASNQLGAVESGFLAAATSATFSVVFGGVACLAVLAVVAVRSPELRGYRIPAAE